MLLRRIVDIRPGELRPALFAGGVLALMIAAHTVTETARDALFLSKLPPERLTLVYALLAVLSLVAGAGSTVLAARFGRRAAFVFSLQACAYGAVVLYLWPPTPVTVFILYLGSGVVGTVLTLQFWMMAGQLFTVAQGKRLFGPIAAGGVLGAALGGTVAAIALRFIPTGALLLVAGGLFLAAGALVAGIPSNEVVDRGTASVSAFGWVRDFSALRKERYVKLVAALTVFGTATVLVADYLFKLSAFEYYPKEQLGSFFAAFYAAQNGVALVVQLFLTGALVRRLGVTGALLVLPLLLALSGTTAALGGGFMVALAAKGADGSLRHSLHRVSSELLLLPLPSDVRDKAKPVIDTVFGRGTQAVVAAAILGLTMVGLGKPRYLGAAMGLFGVLWIVTAVVIRKPYVDLFRRALARGEIPAGGHPEDLDIASVETIMEALSSREEDRVMAAIDVLEDSGRSRVLPALILYHDSPRVLERALAVVATPDRRDWIQIAERLVKHKEASVRSGAIRALAAIGQADVIQRGLDDENETVRACAAFFLAKQDAPPAFEEHDHIAKILGEPGQEGFRARAGLLAVIGDHGDPGWLPVVERIVEIDGKRRGVAPLVAAAAQKTRGDRLLDYLVSQLGVREGRGTVRDAIVAIGERATVALKAALDDPATPERVRAQVPKTLVAFRSQATVDDLTARLGTERSGAVRYKILRALGKLSAVASEDKAARLKFDRNVFELEARKHLVEHLRMKGLVASLKNASEHRTAEETAVGLVLLSLLGDKVSQSLERAFRALQLAHRNEDIASVHSALVRGDKRARGNALEFLDSLPIQNRETKELFRLVADELDDLEVIRRARVALAAGRDEARLDTAADHDRAVTRLLADSDDLVAALTAYHALDLGSIALANEALGVLQARPALERLGAVAPKPRRDSAHG